MDLRGDRVKAGQGHLSIISATFLQSPIRHGNYLRDPHLRHQDMYILEHSYSQQEVVYCFDALGSSLSRPMKVLPGTLSANLLSLLTKDQPIWSMKAPIGVPRTSIFFSGSRFPLATPSSIEDHRSFFASTLFGLSWSLEGENCVYVEALIFLDDMSHRPQQKIW
jgi:hypothetical protein